MLNLFSRGSFSFERTTELRYVRVLLHTSRKVDFANKKSSNPYKMLQFCSSYVGAAHTEVVGGVCNLNVISLTKVCLRSSSNKGSRWVCQARESSKAKLENPAEMKSQ